MNTSRGSRFALGKAVIARERPPSGRRSPDQTTNPRRCGRLSIAFAVSSPMNRSETDLIYPPDADRFGTWLAETVFQSIKVLGEVAMATHAEVAPLGEGLNMMEKFKAAGLTDFSRLKRGR